MTKTSSYPLLDQIVNDFTKLTGLNNTNVVDDLMLYKLRSMLADYVLAIRHDSDYEREVIAWKTETEGEAD